MGSGRRAIVLPLLHQPSSPVEQVGSAISRHGLVAYGMRQSHFCNRGRGIRALSRPIARASSTAYVVRHIAQAQAFEEKLLAHEQIACSYHPVS